MPFYVGDYLADTTHMTTLEHGAYLLLLSTMWRAGGSLPADDAKLSRFARLTPAQWDRIKGTILSFFDMEDGEITQRRLTREMERHSKAVKQRRDSGSLGGKAKALKNKENAVAGATISPKQPEPEPKKETEANASAKNEPKFRGTRLPDGWTPEPQDYAFAVSEGMTPQEANRAADEFRDYWRACAGQRGVKLDWSATWRNWCRRAAGDRKGVASRPAQRNGGGQGVTDFASIVARRRGEGGNPDDVPGERGALSGSFRVVSGGERA
jgi:uncharacterized protein YdaU (DUF1376 family)